MGRPRHADGQRTRQAILDAALTLFAESGYFGTSLRDIGRAVSIRESALYNYFPSKEALFEALLCNDQQLKAESWAGVVNKPIRDARVTLTRLALLTLEHFSIPTQQQLFRILMSDGIRLAQDGRLNVLERMSSGQARWNTLMGRLVKEGWLRAADPQVLAMEFIGPLLLWRHLHAIKSMVPSIHQPRVFARRHVNHFLQGAAVRSKRTRAQAPGDGRLARHVKNEPIEAHVGR